MMPGRELLEIYKANGGKYVTIGSDAHVVEDVGEDYVMAKSLLEEVELQEVVYKQRQRCIVYKLGVSNQIVWKRKRS